METVREDRIPARRKNIMWDMEWLTLTDILVKRRINDASSSMSVLIKNAMEQLPKDRRRTITDSIVRRLSDMVHDKMKRLLQVEEANVKLQAELASRPDAGQLITNMTDMDVAAMFTDRVLRITSPADILSIVGLEKFLAAVPDEAIIRENTEREIRFRQQTHPPETKPETKPEPEPAISELAVAMGHRPVVVVYGTRGDQARYLRDQLNAQVILVFKDKTTTGIPYTADLYVVWAKFSNHNLYHQVKDYAKNVAHAHFIEHFGGISEMVTAIKRALLIRV